jgi:hypothetical protein
MAAIRATEITSSTGFAWFGMPLRPLPRRLRDILSSDAMRAYLALQLSQRLYSHFYCPGFARPVEGYAEPSDPRAEFIAALSEANCGRGTWEPGWEAHRTEDGVLVVEKGGLHLLVRPEDCRAPAGAGDYTEGQVELLLPREMLGVSPGFYMAVGDTPFSNSAAELLRIYWNATPEGAIRLIGETTKALNSAGIPFRIKSLNNPNAFRRCDSVVLYLPKSNFAGDGAILGEIHRCAASFLKPGIPAMTRLLAPGVGLAEGPLDGGSFGMSRCAMIADGLIQAHGEDLKDREKILDAVDRAFQRRGISLEEPFLNAGSRDTYRWPLEPGSMVAASVQNTPLERAGAESRFQDAALVMGRWLCSEALWAGNQCNWIGPVQEPGDHRPAEYWEKSAALGPDVYSGTCGISLFLAELHVRAIDEDVRKAALGAIRQAIAHVEALTPRTSVGFYCGWTGVALSAARIGGLLGEETLLEEAARLVRRFGAINNGVSFDAISGCAGAIPALLTLGELLEDRHCLDLAVQMGNRLLRTAHRSAEGWSWKSVSERRNLTGLSHGAAGAGYALVELYHATGQHQYRNAAEEAFRYERHWFSPEEGNWRDLRSLTGRRLGLPRSKSFAMTWCHGAPGIALSRLRAYEVTGDEVLLREAEEALKATRRGAARTLAGGDGDDSLCHGGTGNADVLLCGDEALGQGLGREVALRSAEAISEQWSPGAGVGHEGRYPVRPQGLMLGIAGAGYFLLRLASQDVPSVLTLGRELVLTSNRDRSSQPTRHRSVS